MAKQDRVSQVRVDAGEPAEPEAQEVPVPAVIHEGPPEAPASSADPAPLPFDLIARVQKACALVSFQRVEEVGGPGSGVLQAKALFQNGVIVLGREKLNRPWTVLRAELRSLVRGKPVAFDQDVLRMALAFRLAPFNPTLSAPLHSQWTFGGPPTSDRNTAVILCNHAGKYSLTLRPGTPSPVLLGDQPNGIPPLLLVERVLELVQVGQVHALERGVVHCQEGDILLTQEGGPRGVWVPQAVRMTGEGVIPLEAFELAAELGFGALVRYEPPRPVMFERGSIELSSEDPPTVRRVSTRAGLVLVAPNT